LCAGSECKTRCEIIIKFYIILLHQTLVNQFGITDTDMQGRLGQGLYLNGSVFDHSCEPNATQTFDGVELTIRLIQDIPDYSWEKVRGWSNGLR